MTERGPVLLKSLPVCLFACWPARCSSSSSAKSNMNPNCSHLTGQVDSFDGSRCASTVECRLCVSQIRILLLTNQRSLISNDHCLCLGIISISRAYLKAYFGPHNRTQWMINATRASAILNAFWSLILPVSVCLSSGILF